MVSDKRAKAAGVIAPIVAELNEDVVIGFDSFDQVIAHFDNTTGVVEIGDVAGDGYSITRDKDLLVNVPFILIDWKEITDPSTLRDYATIRVMTSDGRKYRFSDGSTGIYKQLREIRDRMNLTVGIAVPKGLTKSEFFVSEETKEIVPADFEGPKFKAATFYLNTSS